jgi:hypothetical protein
MLVRPPPASLKQSSEYQLGSPSSIKKSSPARSRFNNRVQNIFQVPAALKLARLPPFTEKEIRILARHPPFTEAEFRISAMLSLFTETDFTIFIFLYFIYRNKEEGRKQVSLPR